MTDLLPTHRPPIRQWAFTGPSDRPARQGRRTRLLGDQRARNATHDEVRRPRVIKTLRARGVEVDETVYLGGVDKAKILEAMRPHIFFRSGDASERARPVIPSARVPERATADPEAGSNALDGGQLPRRISLMRAA